MTTNETKPETARTEEAPKRPLTPEAERALAEAEERRKRVAKRAPIRCAMATGKRAASFLISEWCTLTAAGATVNNRFQFGT